MSQAPLWAWAAMAATGWSVGCGATTAPPEQPPSSLAVSITVDDSPVQFGSILEPTPLAALVDPAEDQWTRVVAVGSAGGRVQLADPAQTQPGTALVLVPQSDGTLQFGLFRILDGSEPPGLRKRLSAPQLHVDDVQRIELTTRGHERSDATPDGVLLTLEPGGLPPFALTRSAFLELPRLEEEKIGPTEGLTNRARRKLVVEGPSLESVLALAAPESTVLRATLSDERGDTVVLEFAVPQERPAALLRLNRRGGLVLEPLTVGADAPARLRNITRIAFEVAPK